MSYDLINGTSFTHLVPTCCYRLIVEETLDEEARPLFQAPSDGPDELPLW